MTIVVASWLLATGAIAHDRGVSYSTWDIRGRHAHVTVRIAQLELTRLPFPATGETTDPDTSAYLTERLRLLADDQACAVAERPHALVASPGRVTYEWSLDCPAGALRIETGLLLDVAPTHLHFARVSRDGAAALERVLSDDQRVWRLDAASPAEATAGTSVTGYIGLGVEHIWTGYDHMAFILALVLIGSSLGEVAKVVTGFTVAHSITLALAVLGYVRPERAPIEALIGLSIALVAAENVWVANGRGGALPWVIGLALAAMALLAASGHGRVPGLTLAGLALFSLCYFALVGRVARPAPLRWAIAFVFGLVHGFGFAAVLLEADLSAERLVRALFGFNLGVELGQLAVVSLIWPLLRLAVQRGGDRVAGLIVEVGSAAVFALGVLWFVSRVYG